MHTYFGYSFIFSSFVSPIVFENGKERQNDYKRVGNVPFTALFSNKMLQIQFFMTLRIFQRKVVPIRFSPEGHWFLHRNCCFQLWPAQFQLFEITMESIVASKDRLHFFEYMEVEVLQQYFRTGIHYFVNSILNGYPQLIRFRYYSLEIATALDFLKDFYALLSKNSTYAEGFFDFERKGGSGRVVALKSALVWTILPYLMARLEGFFNHIVGEQIDGRPLSKTKKIFKAVFPFVYTITSIIQIVLKFRYLYSFSEKEKYYSLWYQINGTHLGHRPSAEEGKYPILELLKKPGILVVLMAHKILNWYFSNRNAKRTSRVREERVEIKAPLQQQATHSEGRCPICAQSIRTPTMVRTTGYVYCFDCINQYVRRELRCPMSRLPVSVEALQVLYN